MPFRRSFHIAHAAAFTVLAFLPESAAAQSLSGKVTSSSSGSAVASASVQVRNAKRVVKSASTDATGQFHIDGLKTGRYTVGVSASGYRSETRKIKLPGAETLNFVLDEEVTCEDPVVDVSPGSTNDSVEGPVCVRVKVDALRYVAKVGENVSRDSAVDVSGLFPVAAASGPTPGKVPAPGLFGPSHIADADIAGLGCGDHVPTPTTMEEAFKNLLVDKCAQRRLLDQDLAQVRSKETRASALLDEINTTIQVVDEQVSKANMPDDLQPLFATGGPISKTTNDISQFTSSVEWPKFEDRLTYVRGLADNLEAFRLARYQRPTTPPAGTTYTFADFVQVASNMAAYTDLKAELQQLETDVRAALTDAARFQTFQKRVGTLAYWNGVLSSTTKTSFFITHEVTSGTLFNFTKHKKIQLATQDRLPTLQQQPVPASATSDLITVDFGNPFSISGGVAFSSIGEREFAIVDSPGPPNTSTMPPTPTSIKTFGITNKSTFHPVPIGIVHGRLTQWGNGNVGLHASFGIDGKFQPDNAGGSGVEFLTGISLSLRRFAYFTVGWHLGRTSRLTGGFKVGDQVPSGISSPPLQKSYTSGVGIAITFTAPSK